MSVLVTAASRHGATSGIAERIADVLRTRGYEVELADPDEVRSLDGVGAVVLGVAVHTSGWLKPARRFASLDADQADARNTPGTKSATFAAMPVQRPIPRSRP